LRGGSDGDVTIVESDTLIEHHVKMCSECQCASECASECQLLPVNVASSV
jgi:hypothetical protein